MIEQYKLDLNSNNGRDVEDILSILGREKGGKQSKVSEEHKACASPMSHPRQAEDKDSQEAAI